MKKVLKHMDLELIILIFLSLYMGLIYFSVALSNIFMGLAIFVFITGWYRNKIQLCFQKRNILVFLMLIIPFILTVFSVLHSEDWNNGLKYLWLRLPVFILPLILIFMDIKYKSIKTGAFMFTGLTLAATLITLFKSVNLVGEGIILNSNFTFFVTPIQHPYFGIYLLITFVSVIELKLFNNKDIRFIILGILFAGIILSTSRLAYILLFFSILFYGIQYSDRKVSLTFFILFFIFSGTFLGLNKSMQSKFRTSLSYQNSPRLKLWNNALKVVDNSGNKLLGIGIGDYYKDKKDPYFFKENETGIYGYDPHSQVFDFFITNGYLGLFILTSYFLFLLKRISVQNRFVVFIFIIISAFSFTESILNRQYGVQLYSVLFPLIFSNQLKRSR